MSRTARIFRGLGAFYAGQFLVLLVGLWTTRFILERVGKADYGLWLIGQQILTYLALTEFGLLTLVPREIGKLTGQLGADPTGALQAYVNQTAHLLLWLMPVVGAAAATVWFFLPEQWEPLRTPLGVALVSFTMLFPLRLLPAALSGGQDWLFSSIAGTLGWLIGTGMSVGLLLAGLGLDSLAWGWLAGQATTTIACGLRLAAKFPHLLPRHLPALRWSAVRPHLGDAGWASLNSVAVVLFNATDLFLIGRLLGPEAVVPYACTLRLIQALGTYAQSAMQMSLPALAEARETETPERLRDICQSLLLCQLLATGAVVCVLLAVNGAFVAFWLQDPSLFGGPALNALLLLNLLLRHLNLSLAFSLFALGHNRLIPLVNIADGLVTVGLGILFLGLFGPVGAVLGSLAALVLIALPVNFFALGHSFDASPWRLLAALPDWLGRFALAAAGAAAAATLIPISGLGRGELLAVIIGVTLGFGLLYGILMLPVLRPTPLGRVVLPLVAQYTAWLPFRPRLQSDSER
jgi:O-antigen/teichoic acid export membrane protein